MLILQCYFFDSVYLKKLKYLAGFNHNLCLYLYIDWLVDYVKQDHCYIMQPVQVRPLGIKKKKKKLGFVIVPSFYWGPNPPKDITKCF